MEPKLNFYDFDNRRFLNRHTERLTISVMSLKQLTWIVHGVLIRK